MSQRNALRLGATVADIQQAALRRHPSATALVGEGNRLTYAEVAGRVFQNVRLFESLGLQRGDGFAILATNRLEVIFANLAAQSMGLRYTPLHPKGSEDDHLYIIDHAGISALLVDCGTFADRGRAIQAKCPLKALLTIDGDFGVDITQTATRFSSEPVPIAATADDICNIYYTGGTTGRPKGVAHRHSSVVEATVLSLAHWDWPSEIRFAIATPISHAAGGMLTPTLIRGGAFHILDGFDPKTFLETVERERITATFVVPSMIYDFLDKTRVEEYDLSSLEMIIYGAAPILPARLEEAIARFGPKFCQLYGQTECPNTISYLSKADHDLTRPERLQSCGFPLVPNQVKLLKLDGTEAGPEEAGEICVRGPLVMDHYWRDPEQTAKVFEGGWLHTGDIARCDADGYLYIVDRAKDMIITGGFNVFTREVEDCISQHPSVSSAAVIGIPHPRWGEAVAAFVVLKPNCAVTEEELVALVRDKKGPIQAPKSIEFLERLPVTPIGKIDKKALRAKHWVDSAREVA